MAEMLIQSESLTSIADGIRVLSGTEDAMGLDAMATHVNTANSNVSTESDLIAQIQTALQGKASGGGESANVATCTVRLVEGSQVYFDVGYTNGNMEYVYTEMGLIDGEINELTNVACGTILYLHADGAFLKSSINGGTLIYNTFNLGFIALNEVQNGGEVVIDV